MDNSDERVREQLDSCASELEEAYRELRRVSHYRSLFLARMSHELRTPLTSILGFSEILLDHEELTETQRRFCQKIQASGFQLQTSLNQLVDLSRIEGGQTNVFLQEVSMQDILRESCAALARIANIQQVGLDYTVAPGVTTVVSDQGKLRQILYNFLAWALSRSKPGQSVTINADITSGTVLQLCIDDLGDPIADSSRLFDPQVPSTGLETNLHELGIIICYRLVDVLNGSVKLLNRDNGGLRTLIQLPVRPEKG